MKVKVLLAAFIILGISFTIFQTIQSDSTEMITKKEAEKIATELYGGKVLSSTAKNQDYQMKIDNETGIYTLDVNGVTKKVSNVKMVEKKTQLATLEDARKKIEKDMNGVVEKINHVGQKGEFLSEAHVRVDKKTYIVQFDLKKQAIVDSHEKKSAPVTSQNGNKSEQNQPGVITEQKAKEIAVQKINGKVTALSEVTNKNGKHYQVTVDGLTDGAHVFIQANTGKVTTISWYKKNSNQDDDDDDDNEDDDDDD